MKWKIQPNHVGISVANIKESIAWYKKHLGCVLESEDDFSEIKTKIAFLSMGNFRIELFEHYNTQKIQDYRKHPLTDMQHQGTLHICFSMENGITGLFENFKTAGVKILMGPILSPTKDALMGFISDNTGNLIEFIQPLKKQ